MKIHLIVSEKEKRIPHYHRQATNEYAKRLSRYASVRIIYRSSMKKSAKESSSSKAFVFRVSSQGSYLSSEELAAMIKNLAGSGHANIHFCIGAAPDREDKSISISPLTMSPSLETVIMLEQIYRAFRIIRGEPYHK